MKNSRCITAVVKIPWFPILRRNVGVVKYNITTLNCVVFYKNEIYWPISFIDKLSCDFGLLSEEKFDLEDWLVQY